MTHLYMMDLPGGKTPAANHRKRTRISSRLVSGWEIPCLRDLVEQTAGSSGKPLRAGGMPVRLSKSFAVYSNPAWSPDGTKSSCFAATLMIARTAPSTADKPATPT